LRVIETREAWLDNRHASASSALRQGAERAYKRLANTHGIDVGEVHYE
jgi:hypothetical protein